MNFILDMLLQLSELTLGWLVIYVVGVVVNFFGAVAAELFFTKHYSDNKIKAWMLFYIFPIWIFLAYEGKKLSSDE